VETPDWSVFRDNLIQARIEQVSGLCCQLASRGERRRKLQRVDVRPPPIERPEPCRHARRSMGAGKAPGGGKAKMIYHVNHLQEVLLAF